MSHLFPNLNYIYDFCLIIILLQKLSLLVTEAYKEAHLKSVQVRDIEP